MTDHPIIFSAPMVRAILDGRKTMTRRVLKPQPQEDIGLWLAERKPARWTRGDRLWVRETFRVNHGGVIYDAAGGQADKMDDEIVYAADCDQPKFWTWRSPIQMSRFASRITLLVTDVRVERLQDISEADAMAEGATKVRDNCYVIRGFDYDLSGLCHSSAVTPFWKYWTHLHGPDAWERNDWVSVTTFVRVT